MNTVTLQVIKKDWHFFRTYLLGYALLSALSLALMAYATEVSFMVGSVLLITVVVTSGIHMTFASVIYERTKQTLPFIMSLPITYMQYTRAKLIGTLGLYGIFWTLLLIVVKVVLQNVDDLPNGLWPFATIILTELFVANLLMLSVAMITESEAWTIVVMAVCNVGISIFMYFVRTLDDISAHMNGAVAVWNSAAFGMIAALLLIATVFISITLFVQSKKRDFL